MMGNIIFVDDEVGTINALRRVFKKEPFVFFGFGSACLALEQMEQIVPQVVLADQCMPEMKGDRFLKKVREKWPETTRMILTGFGLTDRLHRAVECGDVSKVLEKPWDNHVLRDEMRYAFNAFDKKKPPCRPQCEICGEKVESGQLIWYGSFRMCYRCRNWYDLLPDQVFEGLERFVIGNVM